MVIPIFISSDLRSHVHPDEAYAAALRGTA
jgi:hypothetical protein